jgi:hypothetical protein
MDGALSVVIEPLARGRTVLFVGDPQSLAAARLGELAARLEVAPRGARQRPSRAVATTRPSRAGGTLRSYAESGEWDLVVVGDASALIADAAQMRELSESLSRRGHAVLAVEAESVAYDAFYAALRAHFACVRMLGQASFAGQSVVDFAAVERDTSLTFDGTLLGGQAPQPLRFIGICGARDVEVDAHTIVQHPEEARASTDARREVDAARARLEHAEKRLDQAQREIARSGQKLDELRHELVRGQTELTRAQEQQAKSNAKLLAMEVDLHARKAEIAAKDAALAEARREAQSEKPSAEFHALEQSLHARGKELVELREELQRRATLVRDLIEASAVQAKEAPAPIPVAVAPSIAPPSNEALVRAQKRAVDAEAARTDAVFARDEMQAALKHVEQLLARETKLHAAETGQARGLASRLAEVEEQRAQTEARLALLRTEMDTLVEHVRTATREKEMALEQYALSVAQTHALTHEHETRQEPGVDVVSAELETLRETRRALADEGTSLRNQLLLAETELTRVRSELTTHLRTVEDERSGVATRFEALTRASEAHAEGLRGELVGLRFRLQESEASRSAFEAKANAPVAVVEPANVESLRQAHQAVVALQTTTQQRADSESQRAVELSQQVLALDSLVARLQTAVAQETELRAAANRGARALETQLAAAREERDVLEAVHAVRIEEERRSLAAMEARVSEIESTREQASSVGRGFRTAITEARALLADAVARLPVPGPTDARGGDETLRVRVDEMRRAMEDRDIMLRSLTAQLQDKDDRIRGLEQNIRNEASGSTDLDALRSSVSERDQRITRLRAELEEERALRGRAAGSESEVRRLTTVLAEREAQAMELEGRATAALKEQKEARDTFAQARARLESLLGDTKVSEAAGVAEHVSELMRLLRRF